MSYQEKRTITSIAAGILVLAAYCIYAFGNIPQGVTAAVDLKFWAGTMLTFIGIGVAAMIIIQIIFHIVISIALAVKNREYDEKEIEKTIKNSMVEDEMVKLIELKSLRVGYTLTGIGFVAALITLVCGFSVAVMLNILFLSLGVGSMLEGVLSLYYYRKGVKNG